jgi:hypothetical protein
VNGNVNAVAAKVARRKSKARKDEVKTAVNSTTSKKT